jgi:hypothetical protein
VHGAANPATTLLHLLKGTPGGLRPGEPATVHLERRADEPFAHIQSTMAASEGARRITPHGMRSVVMSRKESFTAAFSERGSPTREPPVRKLQ